MDWEQEPSSKSGYKVTYELFIGSNGCSNDNVWELVGLFCIVFWDGLVSISNMVNTTCEMMNLVTKGRHCFEIGFSNWVIILLEKGKLISSKMTWCEIKRVPSFVRHL